MRYDLTLAVKDLDGVQITDDKDTIGYTLRTVLVRTALFVDKAKLPSAEQKLTAYGIAKRIAQAGSLIDLTAEEVAFLKAQAGIMWTPLVLGQLFELLESPIAVAPVPISQRPNCTCTIDAEICRCFKDCNRLDMRKPVTDIPPKA